jgi:hypothetical protein
MKQLTRIPLGTLCKYYPEFDGSEVWVVTVIGCWRFYPRRGLSGLQTIREQRLGLDPNEADDYQGYILLPSRGGSIIHEMWGAFSNGDLVPLFLKALEGGRSLTTGSANPK